jgi:hypothetical protein
MSRSLSPSVNACAAKLLHGFPEELGRSFQLGVKRPGGHHSDSKASLYPICTSPHCGRHVECGLLHRGATNNWAPPWSRIAVGTSPMIRCLGLWWWHINITHSFGHYPSSYFLFKSTTFRKPDFVSVFRWDLLGVCWCPETETSSFYWAHLKTETEFSLRNVVVFK